MTDFFLQYRIQFHSFVHGCVVLVTESQGQRSLVAYSPWGCKELNMTEQLIPSFSQEKQESKMRNCSIDKHSYSR